MNMTLRWYGTGFDSVTLEQIRQIPGVTGVITTLYDSVPGDAWETAPIAAMKHTVEEAGLRVEGIESVNVHDAIKKMLDAVPNVHNGVTLCTGSLASNPKNDIPAIIRQLAGRIHFAHVRNVVHLAPGKFDEAAHLSSAGSLDM